MNKRVFLFILSSIFVFGLTGCKKEQNYTSEQIINSNYSSATEKIEQYLISNKFQGAVLVAKNHEVIFAKGYGPCDSKNKNSEQININSTFEVGSITKQMVAAAIMQQVQKGKISVTDKISKYFPDYAHGDEITIQMLLTMRSGLLDMINSRNEFFPHSVIRQMEKDINAGRQIEEGLVLKYWYEAPLLTTPDTTYFYSNTNYYLLAKILEQVTGQSYYDYIQKNIFAKANMQNSNLNFQQTDTKSYDHKKRALSIPSELTFGCGDVNSSVVDLFKWNEALISGKIVSKKSYKQMIDTDSYGYGLNNQNGEIFHAGSTTGFNSYLSYYPKDKVTVIVLVNQGIAAKNAAYASRKLYSIIEEK